MGAQEDASTPALIPVAADLCLDAEEGAGEKRGKDPLAIGLRGQGVRINHS